MFPPILCSKCYCVYTGYKQILFMRDDLTVLRIFGKNVPRRDAFCRCAAKCYVLSLSRRSFWLLRCWLTGENWSCSFHSSSCDQWCETSVGRVLRNYGTMGIFFHPKTPMTWGADLCKESKIVEWHNMIISCYCISLHEVEVDADICKLEDEPPEVMPSSIENKWPFSDTAPNDRIAMVRAVRNTARTEMQFVRFNPLLSFVFTPFTSFHHKDLSRWFYRNKTPKK